MIAALLALSASGAWGVSDFLGGVRTRTLPLAVVLLLSQAAGLPVLLAVVWTGGPSAHPLNAPALVEAGLAGASGVIALGALYRVTAGAGIALVAPISAAAAALPVLVGLAAGESLTARTLVGVLLALLGALAVGLPSRTAPRRRLDAGALLTASAAAAGGAGYFVLIRNASQHADPSLAALAGKLCGLALIGAWAFGQWPQLRATGRPAGRALIAVAAIGVTDAVAEVCFATASAQAPLAIVTPLASLYPAVAVVLGFVVVRERLGGLGSAGIACAIAGVTLLA